MSIDLHVGNRGWGRLVRASVIGAIAALGLAVPARAVVPTSTASAYEFDTVTVGAGGAAPIFGNGDGVDSGQIGAAAGQILAEPGNGFPLANYAGGANFATGLLGGIPRNTGNINAPGGAGSAASNIAIAGTYYGGGGIYLLPGTYAHSNFVAGAAAIVNATTVAGAFRNPAPLAITLQSGDWFAFSGFMPAGAYGAVSIVANVAVPAGTAPLPTLLFAINGGANDFVSVTPNAAGEFGISKLVETPVAGGFDFAVYAVGYGPKVTFPANSTNAAIEGTMTIIADPMADIDWNPGILPAGINLPTYGPDGIPEPASFSLLALVIGGLAFGRPGR